MPEPGWVSVISGEIWKAAPRLNRAGLQRVSAVLLWVLLVRMDLFVCPGPWPDARPKRMRIVEP